MFFASHLDQGQVRNFAATFLAPGYQDGSNDTLTIRAGQFRFFSAGIAGSVVGIKFSIFYYTTWVFTSIPEELTGLKVGIFQMAISA